MADDHRNDDRLRHFLFRSQELLFRHSRSYGRVRHLENDLRRHHDPRRADLRRVEIRQRRTGGPHQRPLAHGDGLVGVFGHQLHFRLRCDHLRMDYGADLRDDVHPYAGRPVRRAADSEQHVPGVRLPAVQPPDHALGSAQGAGDQDVDLERFALDRRLHHRDLVRVSDGPHGYGYDGRSRDAAARRGEYGEHHRKDGRRFGRSLCHQCVAACRRLAVDVLGSGCHRGAGRDLHHRYVARYAQVGRPARIGGHQDAARRTRFVGGVQGVPAARRSSSIP